MGYITEKASGYSIASTIVPQAVSDGGGAVTGASVDLQGFNSAFVVANLGAETGTLSGTNKITFTIEHSDDNSAWTALTSSDQAGGYTITGSGIWALVDAPSESPAVYKTAYTGNKRYIRVVATPAGTISIPLGVIVLKGDGILPQA